MTKQEIINAVQLNIAGQGSMVDISGKLPEILVGIAESAKFANKAKITVKVYAKKWDADNKSFVNESGVTGVLIVKGFTECGELLPVQEIPFTVPEDEEFAAVEFDATIGDTIGIVGKIAGKGASCQLVQKVVAPTTVDVEIYPAGIYEIGDGALSPTIVGDGYNGCAVVTEDFALALLPHQRDGWKDNYVQWGGMFQPIPFVLKAATDTEAITDFDGALNTAAILSVVKDADCAARVATIMTDPHYTRFGAFLPSAGMLKYLYEHRTEINALIAAANEGYTPDVDYQTIPNDITAWSSTDYADDDNAAVRARYVSFSYGHVDYDYRNYLSIHAFAVSAFQTMC